MNPEIAPIPIDPTRRREPRALVPIVPDRRVPPAPLTELIGRDTERQNLAHILQQSNQRLVTLFGPPGVGKSLLARYVANDLFARDLRVVYLEASTFCPGRELVSELSSALRISSSNSDWNASFARAIGCDRLIVVIDGAELVPGIEWSLTRFLEACESVSILATSRRRFKIQGEFVFPLHPLATQSSDSRSPASELFIARARARDPDFTTGASDLAAIDSICEHVEGLPLAIEHAVERLSVLTPASLLARISSQSGLLPAPNARDAASPNLRTSIAACYDELLVSEQILWEQLALFPDGFSTHSAEAVADLPDGADVLDTLATLVDRSLVLRRSGPDGEPRFSMLRAWRAFALHQLDQRGHALRARQRYVAWARTFAELSRISFRFQDGPLWLDVMTREIGNLRAALEWLDATGHRSEMLELAHAICMFWDYQGMLAEAQDWLERARALPNDAEFEPSSAIFVHYWLGWFGIRTGNDAPAVVDFQRALDIAQSRQLYSIAGYAAAGIAWVEWHQRDLDAAQAHIDEALRLIDLAPNVAGSIETLWESALIQASLRQFDGARAAAERAVELARTTNNQNSLAFALNSLALVDLETGNRSESRTHALQSLETAAPLRIRTAMSDALMVLALLDEGTNDNRSARMLGAAVEALEQSGGARFFMHRSTHELASTLRNRMGAAAFSAAEAAGRALPIDTIIAGFGTTPSKMAMQASATATLTAREMDVLRLLVEGDTDREIAQKLSITYRTTNAYVATILGKLGMGTRTAAATYAVRHGLV